VVPIEKALQTAKNANLDLVEVAPTAKPPVCKVIDLGKYLYQKNKKERQARKSQSKIELKEIRLRPKTNEHHRMFKVRNARRWLEQGIKVQVTIRFRGREITLPEVALEDLREIAKELEDISSVEQAPSMEGRAMHMILVPLKPSKKPSVKYVKPHKEQKKKPVKKTAKKAEVDKTQEKDKKVKKTPQSTKESKK